MSSILQSLRKDWRKNYRYHGGLSAFARCWNGDRKLRQGRILPTPEPPPILDFTVFSVVPEMSALWAVLTEHVVQLRPLRFLLGDCSGGLRGGTDNCLVVPMLNVHHGEKLDLFFEHACRADVVVVCDDDIYWLDEEPLTWALDRLAEDPEIAVVSLIPKPELSSVLRGRVERAMGSLLIVRRSIWQRERLSWRVVYPPPSEGYDWFYDTGEFAQVELGRRGYRVVFGPAELRRHFVAFDGVSSWTLKIQKYSGRILAAVEGIPVRQEKALQTVFFLRGLEAFFRELGGDNTRRHLVVPPSSLDRARRICEGLLTPESVETIHDRVAESFCRIRSRMLALDEIPGWHRKLRWMLGLDR